MKSVLVTFDQCNRYWSLLINEIVIGHFNQ